MISRGNSMSFVTYFSFFYPKLLAVLLVLLTSIPLKIPGVAYFLPMVEVMMIYYWCIYRPDAMPNWFVFALGIFRDALAGVPLGVNALTNVLLRSAVVMMREKYIKVPFLFVWQGFMVFACMAMAVKWVLFSFIFDQLLGLNMAVMQLLLSVAVYPLFHSLLNLVHKILPGGVTDA